MFGFRLVNNDGNVCVDEENPVYTVITDPLAVELVDPQVYDAQVGSNLRDDAGDVIGGFLNVFVRFRAPLATRNPPILLARRRPGQVAATLFAGYCVIGEPGAWQGFRMAITTSDPRSNSTNPAEAYEGIRSSVCDLAACIPGATFCPGTSIRVADSQGRLIFDALGHHALGAQVIPSTLVDRFYFSEGVFDTVSFQRFNDLLGPNEWMCVSGAIGPQIRPIQETSNWALGGLMGRGILSLGRTATIWVGVRYRNGNENISISSYVWKTSTRRRVPASGIVLPQLS